MKNILEDLYEKITAIRNEITHAKDAQVKSELIERLNDEYAILGDCSKPVQYLYSEYERSIDNGNALLDFSGVVYVDYVDQLVACMRECGIHAFTYSSSWSGAVEVAWAFQENGCVLEKMVKINGSHRIVPAFLFKL